MLSPVRRAVVRQVRRTFNDQAKGEKPVPASDDALFPRGSVIRRVHGDVTSMMVGGIAALLTQMLHPKALGGVWDHSVPDGTDYRATDPWLLAWVHVAGAINFLDGWRRYGERRMSLTDQDRYFAESGEIARLLDADPVPQTRAEAERLIAEVRPELRADDRSRAFRDLVLRAPAQSLNQAPIQVLIMNAAVDLLPSFAREMHGLSRPVLPPMVRSATFGLASTIRWAFAGENYRATH